MNKRAIRSYLLENGWVMNKHMPNEDTYFKSTVEVTRQINLLDTKVTVYTGAKYLTAVNFTDILNEEEPLFSYFVEN